MSFSRTSLRGRTEVGFTLIEMMVSLTLLALVAAGMVPLLIAGAHVDLLTKQQTQAKSLSVARIAALRALPFHVDYQNGAYLDVLDEYYTNASATPNIVTATGGTGSYAIGVVPGQTQTGAYYQVKLASPPLPSGFTQAIYTQFLAASTTVGSARAIITPPTTYDSQAATVDAPASPLLGVTVVTSYGGTHSYRSYTELSDTGHDTPLVVGQAGATAVAINSHASDGSLLSAVLAQVGIDGTLSNTSSASASAIGSRFSRTDTASTVGYTTVDGAVASVASPPIPASTLDQTAGSTTIGTSGTCGWGAADPTGTTDVSASVGGAQPMAPTDVETATSPAPSVKAFVRANGGTGTCGALGFTNLLSGSLNPTLGLSSTTPQVVIPDQTGSGQILTASSSLDTPPLVSSPVKAAATVAMNGNLFLFPGMSFIPASTGYQQALVVIQVTSAALNCTANASAATASYSGSVLVWTQSSATTGSYLSTPFTWTTASAVPTLPPLTTTVTYTAGTPVPLSTWLQTWHFNGLVQQAPLGGSTASVGRHAVPAVLSIDTQPTLLVGGTSTPDQGTDILLNVGQLSCVSEDTR